jgi:chromosome segregation ATPase
MELEMSRLRAQVERLSVSAATPSEQITALEEKLARAERAAALAQRELADVKRNLERASEKAVKEGSERTSAETKLRALERTASEAEAAREELAKKCDGLEKKVATLTTLHKEQDQRSQALRRDKERADHEVTELREKLERAEAEAHRLRKKDAADGAGLGDDEAVDALEEEGRQRLEQRVRELEAENSELRRGIWHERRKEMQTGPEDASGRHFSDVDLASNSGLSPSLRRTAGAGLGEFFTTGLNVLTGGGTAGGEDEELLDDDGDMEFDEEAFRRAQQEEAMKRIERVKELKRKLKNWEGWRLDLVESRRGGGEGIGEIFEV